MSKPFSILLVEDNADDEQLTLRALRKLGAQVDVVRDGQEALDRLIDSDEALPDIVLMDLNLPKVNGLELLRRLRENERTAGLVIVVLASSHEPDDVRAGYQKNADSFIEKPVTPENFAEVAGRLGVL